MTDFATINAGHKTFVRDRINLSTAQEQLVDDALGTLVLLRNSYVHRDESRAACKVDELIERLTAIARGRLA